MNHPLLHLSLPVVCATVCLGVSPADATPNTLPSQYGLETKILSVPSTSPWASAAQGISRQALAELISGLATAEDVEVLSAPRVVTLPGQEAVMRIGSALDYFERREDGLFELKSLPEDQYPGIRLSATMRPARDGAVKLDLDLRVSTVLERESIPGVELDVGRPILQMQQVQTQVIVEPGEWVRVGGHRIKDLISQTEDAVVVLARVTLHGPDG